MEMVLEKLSVLNYKNIQQAEVSFSSKMNCFCGNNGMGKTNLLDAIYYLSFCKSHLHTPDSQIIHTSQDVCIVQGTYAYEGREEEVFCAMRRRQRKVFKRNKKEYDKLSEHIGLLPLVMVSPADADLIAGGSEERRRFMDLVISQYDAGYLDALVRYNKALLQRNALLKMEEEPDIELLVLWEEAMAQEGERIYAGRKAYIDEFIPIFQNFYRKISGNKELVGLNYVSHCQRGPLLEVIQRDRAKDRIMGYSLHGVHKDELEMTLDGFPIKKEGSQGQNKTFLIALKLAQFDFLKRTGSKTTPLLLLDDLFDKLDADRVEQIVKLVAGDSFGQIFITDTNRGHLDQILSRIGNDYKLFRVTDGEILEKNNI